MSLDAELRTVLFTQTLTVNAISARNLYGDPAYSTTATTYPCRVDGFQHLVKAGDGRDVIARTVAYVGTTSTGGTPSIGLQDKVTLPDGTIPKILSIDTFRDLSGLNHQAVHCG
jgi:hypothetical protein